MIKFIIYAGLLALNIGLSASIFGQNMGFPSNNLLISDDVNIKSISFSNQNKGSNLPIIKLGEELRVEFDDLDADKKAYKYKLEHCNSNWELSETFESEYLDGFNEVEIRDFKYSFNTLVKYTHYSFSFPNAQIQLKTSGNYLLKVYLQNSEEPAFVRRIVVYEDLLPISPQVRRTDIVSKRDTEQQISISIDAKNINLSNPNQEISLTILQNNDWEKALYKILPQYISGNTLIYNYNDKLNFEAGNSFFYLDTKSIRTADLYTDYIKLEDIYHTYLYTNEPRYNQQYSFQQDFDGGFVIRNIEGSNSAIDADYTYVHFALAYSNLYPSKDYFVYGSFNDYRLEEENRLKFDNLSGKYRTTLLLKQGYYDYKFVAYDHSANILEYNFFSGNFYQNENSYTILVYYRGVNSRIERIVGLSFLKSVNIM